MSILEIVFSLYIEKGGRCYANEPITQLEHALQTALAARRHRVRPELVSAALLHDIEHLLPEHPKSCPNKDSDCQHELLGATYVTEFFNHEIGELIKQHVNAKRYLTATNQRYRNNLSPASQQTLILQGGPMTNLECQQFAAHPLFREILLLRNWDEAAKVPDKKLPCITEFAPELLASLL